MTSTSRPEGHSDKRRLPTKSETTMKRPSTLVILRKSHRCLLAQLRELAAEVQVLHRLWYKGAAQFRHMVWWRPIRRVKVLAARITTGSLAQSVPRARGDACPRPTSADPRQDVMGVRLLRSLADAYVSHWGETETSWSRYVTLIHTSLPKLEAPPCHTLPIAQHDAVRAAAQALWGALSEVEEQCALCYAYV
ncbi:hypothetical protein MEQU1_002310 [Malassezia equina]|uniref:Uncharacterized protein n=1 Tax=Malassezia equina TaxID=1381935 RepID=A0AAF0IZ67_9BASI|nr:hypothetical protein MEQU1_002310 [Malassezia equina]